MSSSLKVGLIVGERLHEASLYAGFIDNYIKRT